MRPMLHRVFVYGTLLVGEENHHIAAPYIRHIQPGKVKGRLYDVGAYPALVIEEEGEVIGEWFTVTKEGLQAMDELEEYEEGSQYNYVYVYPKSKAAHLPFIPSGSWRHRHRNSGV
jgi:gamma-glutamylcyclotransferase (GGCT)/AIG2-like uncharacterized protein YtfP